MSGDRYWHRWGIHAPWGKCLAHLALWMIPRSMPVRRWSWRTDAPSSLSWMNACHRVSLSSFWNSLLLETPAILTIIEWNTVYYCLSITNLKDGFNGTIVFTPGAILIVLDLSNNRHMYLQFSWWYHQLSHHAHEWADESSLTSSSKRNRCS